MSKKYEKAEQWQVDKVAPLIYCTFASTDIAVNLVLVLIEEIRKRKGLMRQKIKMLCGNLKRNIHIYQRGCQKTMEAHIGVLADFNDGMDEFTANNVEMLRLSFRQLFARSGCTDPDICAHAETAVSLCSFADKIFDKFCRDCVEIGLANPRYSSVPYINNKAIMRDVRMIADIIHKQHGVPYMNFDNDEQCVKAFDAVTTKLLNGRKLRESYLRAEAIENEENRKEENEDGKGMATVAAPESDTMGTSR